VKSPNKFRVFCKFLNGRTRPSYSNFRSVSGYAILVVWNLEIVEVWNQKITEVWNQEVVGIRRLRTGEALESRTCEPTRSDLQNSGVTDGGFGNQ
jgi:hypothetical protein